MHSLSRRLLVSVAVPLALFFGVMMWVLDTGFHALSQSSLEKLLDSQMVALIAAAEPQENGGYAPGPNALDSRLATPRSGFYARIRSLHHEWRSPSTVGLTDDFGPLLKPGERTLSYTSFGSNRVAVESRAIQFQDDPAEPRGLTFSVAVSLTPYEEEQLRFRQEMSGWFGGLMAVLLVALAALLHWALSPVRRMEREIHEVEEGRSESLGGGYPRELSGVAVNLNALLAGERRRVARYRDTLGNLAHSLKTPLAVMRASLTPGAPGGGPIGGEISKMNAIIEHQLKRAAASGGALIGQPPVELAQMTAELRAALLRVYAGKDLAIELAVAEGSRFTGDRGDLTEVLGNLLDNACKWCRSHVRLSAWNQEGVNVRVRLVITVEDDGPGIPEADRPMVLKRGVRADENVPGHGLGLAMVLDTVELYGGKLELDASPLGGARFTLRLPGR